MTSPIVAEPRELMAEHLEVLREYCKQVLVREESPVADQEKDKARRMQEFLAMGRSFSVTDKELVVAVFRGLLVGKQRCGCVTCRAGQEV